MRNILLKLLVDTGPTHTVIFPKMGRELGIRVLAEDDVKLADGRVEKSVRFEQ